MSTKLQFYSEFADRTARQITGSYRSWTALLATAARLYKYPYNEQLKTWTDRVEASLAEAGRSKVCIPTVFTAAPAVLKEFEKTPYAARLKKTGVITSYICPLMYMNNPLCGKMPVITSSNKLRTYTTARYYTDDEILARITKGGKHA